MIVGLRAAVIITSVGNGRPQALVLATAWADASSETVMVVDVSAAALNAGTVELPRTTGALVVLNITAASATAWAALPLQHAGLLILVISASRDLLCVPALVLAERVVLHWSLESLDPPPTASAGALLHSKRTSGKGAVTAHGILHVLQSVTPSTRQALAAIVEHVQGGGAPLSLDALLVKCQKMLAAKTMAVLKALLGELSDHRIISTARGSVELTADATEVRAALAKLGS